MTPLVIVPAYDRMADLQQLLQEYAQWIDIDLSFQSFASGLASLPGKYAEPDGRLYLGLCGHDVAGCIALCRFDAERGEVKRLYGRDAFRGKGFARILIAKIIAQARCIGYSALLIDSFGRQDEKAVGLDRSAGFIDPSPYYANPFPDTVYLE